MTPISLITFYCIFLLDTKDKFYGNSVFNHTFISDDSFTSGSNLESKKVMQHSDDISVENYVDSVYDAYGEPREDEFEQKDDEVKCVPE